MRGLRLGVCALSILVILIAGKVGEDVLGAALVLLNEEGLGPRDLRGLSAFVVENYRLNQGHFLLSLVPFAGILATLPFLDRVVADWNGRFWYAFAATWLAFMAYLGLFVYALVTPFAHLGVAADHEPTIVTYATAVVSLVAIAVLMWLFVRKRS